MKVPSGRATTRRLRGWRSLASVVALGLLVVVGIRVASQSPASGSVRPIVRSVRATLGLPSVAGVAPSASGRRSGRPAADTVLAPLFIAATRLHTNDASQDVPAPGRVLLALSAHLINMASLPESYDFRRFSLRGSPSGTVYHPQLDPELLDALLLNDSLEAGASVAGDLVFYVATSDRSFALSYSLDGHRPSDVPIR